MLSPLSLVAAVVTLLSLIDVSALFVTASAPVLPHGAALLQGRANRKTKLTLSRSAAAVRSSATSLNGKFYFQNVGTGKYFMYDNNPQTIILSSSTKSVMELSNYQAGTRVSPVASNDKCFAAQWGSSYDWAVTMYACRYGGEVVDSTGGHPQAKQQWHFIPVSSRSNTYFIVPEDHLDDQVPRAIATKVLHTAGGYLSTALDVYDTSNTSQMWRLISAN